MSVNWVKLEEIGETRFVDALRLALRGISIPEIQRGTGTPKASLYSIKNHGPHEHGNRQKRGKMVLSLLAGTWDFVDAILAKNPSSGKEREKDGGTRFFGGKGGQPPVV